MLKKLKANLPKYQRLIHFYLSSIWDQVIWKGLTKKKQIQREEGLQTILFVTEDPRIDIIRFFQALQKAHSAHYILLINHSNLDPLFEDAGFDELHYFRNHWDFRKKLNRLPAISLVHGFTRRCFVIKILIEEQKLPVVISAKDTSVCSHGLNPPHWYLKEELPAEQFAFQNVKGLIAESLEPCNAFRLYELERGPKRMYFPNLCEENPALDRIPKKSVDALHVVYVGSIRGSQDDPKEHGNIQMHWLIQTLNDQGIHFHVYPNPNMSRVVYEEYYQLDRELEFFHMHESVKPEDLSQELAPYHFGLIPFFNADTNRSPMKRYYSTSLKIFNYLEAGLPLIISKDMGHQRWLFQRYGLALGIDKNEFFDLNQFLEKLDYSALIENLKIQRKKMMLDKQIHRVIAFYQDCLK